MRLAVNRINKEPLKVRIHYQHNKPNREQIFSLARVLLPRLDFFCLPTNSTSRALVCKCFARHNMWFSDFNHQARASQFKYLKVTDLHELSHEPVCAARGLARRCLHSVQITSVIGLFAKAWLVARAVYGRLKNGSKHDA